MTDNAAPALRGFAAHRFAGDVRKFARCCDALRRKMACSAARQPETFEHAVELVERAEGDGDLALLALAGALPHPDLHRRGQRVRERLLDAHEVARFLARRAHEPSLAPADRVLAR